MIFRLAAPAALAALLVATPALATKPTPKQPAEMSNGWVREAPPGAQVMGAYFTLKNTSGKTLTLKGVSSPLYERVEMHEIKPDAGRVKMVEVESFSIKAGETLTLKPGGAHLMMFTPKRELKTGDKVPFTFDFGQAGQLKAEFPVKRPEAAPKGHDHHDHGHDHGHDHH